MNTDTAQGKLDQLKGQVKQSVGEAVGNDKLANSGVADQVKGAAKEAWGNTKDAAQAVADDARAHAEIKHAEAREHGHDLREKIASTAQNVKDAISEKAEEIKLKHEHLA
jgi:uncharacterized protein YjbJ (UPF0337 family)